jgi:hypothetical protein
MTFDLPKESCAGQREEVPDKGYSTGYFMPVSSKPSQSSSVDIVRSFSDPIDRLPPFLLAASVVPALVGDFRRCQLPASLRESHLICSGSINFPSAFSGSVSDIFAVVEGNGIHATQVSNQDTAVLLHYP